ncbi:MAG: hypothetical protein PHY12_15580, partial [Eubacteriales bacterium]|nr:hypothetical protein [Eubacteriales bacterium]
MNKAELTRALEETVPPLKGKLHVERVLYKKAANKAYMSYLCDDLVPERDFLALERRLRTLFPQIQVALRVASPGLGEDFVQNLDKYRSVLTDFLRRQSPALKAWLEDVGWTIDDGRILLTCPDDFAIHFFKTHQLDEKLSRCVWDIFRVRMPVALVKCGQREEWVKAMRAQRQKHHDDDVASARQYNEHVSAPGEEPPLWGPADGEYNRSEPPPWDDASIEAQAAALPADYGMVDGGVVPGAPPASAPKPQPSPRGRLGGGSQSPSQAADSRVKPLAVLKGRAIADKPVDIVELGEDSGIVVIEGEITGVTEAKELKGGETVLVTFAVFDDSSTIYCKAFYQYRMKRAGFGETPQQPTDEERK